MQENADKLDLART